MQFCSTVFCFSNTRYLTKYLCVCVWECIWTAMFIWLFNGPFHFGHKYWVLSRRYCCLIHRFVLTLWQFCLLKISDFCRWMTRYSLWGGIWNRIWDIPCPFVGLWARKLPKGNQFSSYFIYDDILWNLDQFF